jgi:hypothetical protein
MAENLVGQASGGADTGALFERLESLVFAQA